MMTHTFSKLRAYLRKLVTISRNFNCKYIFVIVQIVTAMSFQFYTMYVITHYHRHRDKAGLYMFKI